MSGKKVIKILSVIAIFVCMVVKPYYDESKLERVEASVWATADEAIAWVKSQINKSLDYDGVYGAQCVDLIKYYYDYLGVTPASGNGSDYSTNPLPSGWQRIKGATPQKGDILVYTGGDGNYGHVAIYESQYSTYHQNYGSYTGVVHVTNVAYNGLVTPYWGVVRPDFAGGDSRVDVGTGFYGYIINTKQWRHFTNDGSNVSLRTGTGAPNQVWYFERQANGDYLIKSDVDGSYLEVAGNSSTAGANVQTGAYDGDSGQQWCLYGESGAYVFGVRCSNSVLEVKDDSTAEGANIWVNTPWDTSKQYFQIWKLDDYVQPTSVSLNKTSATLTSKGATVSLTATVSPSNATNKEITWSSSNTSVATVNSSGVVTAVGNGTATITAKTVSGAKVVTCSISVGIPTLNSDGWYYTTVLPSNVTSSAYEIQYQNIYYEYAANKPGSEWVDTGVDKKVETQVGDVQESPKPLATSESFRLLDVYYYHWCGDGKGIHVNYCQNESAGYNHWDAVSMDRAWEYASYQDVDDSSIMYYHLKWSDNSDAYCLANSTCDGSNGYHGNRSYYWYKSYVYQNYKIEYLNQYKKISEWGLYDWFSSSVNIRYRALPTGVTLNKTSATLSASGATVALTATVSPSGANTAVTWKSSNTAVATVSSSGVVTAVGNGTATITATTKSGGKTTSCTVTVNIIPTGVSLNYTTASYTSSGATLQLVATVSPSNAVNKNVIWKSSNESVAAVDANGLVTTKGNGIATITATTVSGGKTATCTVTVKIAPTGVYMDKTTATLTEVGETLQLIATVTPNNAIDKTVKWDSSNKAVATVNDKGLVTAVGNGTTNITVTTVTGGKTFTCKITVSVKLSGLCKASDGNWYYYVDGKVDSSYTGMAKNENGWFYVKKGKVDLNYIGLAENKYGTWYMVDGKVASNISGLTKVSKVWLYLIKGKVDTSYTGLAKNEYGWWYVTEGQLDKTYTGMAKNENGWFYVKSGKVDLEYTGLAENEYGTWYMVDGQVASNISGLTKVSKVWMYLVKGKVDTDYVGLAKNESGWWYVENGTVDFTYTGMAKNQYGWWYVTNGKLDRSFTGIASNEYGRWYIKNGAVEKTYTGTVKYNGVTYNIKDGKVL